MLKKIICFIICVAALLCFTACGSSGNSSLREQNPSAAEDAGKEEIAEDSFVVDGVVLSIGGLLDEDALAPLGTPSDVQAAPSCHYDGNDTIYIYDGLVIYTYSDKSDEVVYLIEVTGDSYSAYKNTKVGFTVDEIKTVLGEPEEETSLAVVYDISDDTSLRFSIEDSVVTMIEYEERT